jgi:hypothetical protein
MKYWKIPNTVHPTWAIDLSQLNDFTEILDIMKSLGIIKYVYSFIFRSIIIKYGISADNSRMYGERIYRQAGHLDGWNRKLQGPSGSDMRIIADDYFIKSGTRLNRVDMIIVIEDLTLVVSNAVADPARPCRELESKRIQEHIEQYGEKPIGNKNDESHIPKKSYVSVDNWAKNFEEE